MSDRTSILISVANELVAQAKSKMPELRANEEITREWFGGGVFYRETDYENKLFLTEYDFRKKEPYRKEVKK